MGSCRGIEHLRLVEDFMPEIQTPILRCVQVCLSAENLRQLSLHCEDGQAWRLSGLKLHQHVHVASGREVIAQHRAEERQLANVMAPAKRGDFFSWDLDLRPHLQASTGTNLRALQTGSSARAPGSNASPLIKTAFAPSVRCCSAANFLSRAKAAFCEPSVSRQITTMLRWSIRLQ